MTNPTQPMPCARGTPHALVALMLAGLSLPACGDGGEAEMEALRSGAGAQDDGSVRIHHDVYGKSGPMDGQAEEMKAPPRIDHGSDAAPPEDGRRTGRRG